MLAPPLRCFSGVTVDQCREHGIHDAVLRHVKRPFTPPDVRDWFMDLSQHVLGVTAGKWYKGCEASLLLVVPCADEGLSCLWVAKWAHHRRVARARTGASVHGGTGRWEGEGIPSGANTRNATIFPDRLTGCSPLAT